MTRNKHTFFKILKVHKSTIVDGRNPAPPGIDKWDSDKPTNLLADERRISSINSMHHQIREAPLKISPWVNHGAYD